MKQEVSQAKILAQVDALVARHQGRQSLWEVGYTHIGIDDGWQACGTGFNGSFHDAHGKPLINLTRFPDMKAMNAEAHSKGVKMGWYANNCGCSEAAQFGSIGGHVRQDAEATAELGFDSTKVDGCGPSQDITEWTKELNAAAARSGRPILLEDCLTKRYTRRGEPSPVPLQEVFRECPGNFFRLGPDIAPQFFSTMYNLIFTYNLMARYNSDAHPASRPGCWTYSDVSTSHVVWLAFPAQPSVASKSVCCVCAAHHTALLHDFAVDAGGGPGHEPHRVPHALRCVRDHLLAPRAGIRVRA
jgi:hypothetical protein|eukprot:COSAG01_NODE_1020_length_12097_cov_3.014919_9_plen_301_part_00